MHGEAPAIAQDQPVPSLDQQLAAAGVPRSLTPEQLRFAREHDLRLDGEGGEGEGEEPSGGTPEGGQPEAGGEGGDAPVALDTFDPTQIPEDASRDWLAERHQQLVADYTKKTQATAAERQEAEQALAIITALEDEQRAPAVLAALGFEFDEGDGQAPGEPEYVDPDERIAQLEARLDQNDQVAQQSQFEAAVDDQIAEELEALEQKEDTEFSPEEVKFLTTQSHATGAPIEAIHAEFKGMLDKRFEDWKERRKAPRRLSSGSAASKTVDLTDPKQRRAAMVQAAEEARAGASSE